MVYLLCSKALIDRSAWLMKIMNYKIFLGCSEIFCYLLGTFALLLVRAIAAAVKLLVLTLPKLSNQQPVLFKNIGVPQLVLTAPSQGRTNERVFPDSFPKTHKRLMTIDHRSMTSSCVSSSLWTMFLCYWHGFIWCDHSVNVATVAMSLLCCEHFSAFNMPNLLW